jgi:hypothetical protein
MRKFKAHFDVLFCFVNRLLSIAEENYKKE